jgi:hypothetical protein
MSTLSLVWGILAMAGMLVGFFPCLGSLNWLNIPFSGVGLIVSIVALANAAPEQKGAATAGTVLCAIGVGLGFIRLMAGGGIL